MKNTGNESQDISDFVVREEQPHIFNRSPSDVEKPNSLKVTEKKFDYKKYDTMGYIKEEDYNSESSEKNEHSDESDNVEHQNNKKNQCTRFDTPTF